MDYSELEERLQSLLCYDTCTHDPAQVKAMIQELNSKVMQLQSNLQRINAPNMRAMEK